MSMLRRIFGLDRNGRSPGSAPLSFPPPINVAAIAVKLRVVQKGAQRGVQDLPPTKDTGFDEIEQEIIDHVESIRNKGLDDCDKLARFYTQLMSTNNVNMQIQSQCNVTVDDLEAAAKLNQGNLKISLKEYQDADVAFRQFRNNNSINDPAHGDNGFLKWFAVSLVIIAAESVLNGVFFAKAHEMGLAGGVGNALAISVVNVGLASLAGLVTRNFNHVRPWRKIIGALSFLGAACLALLFNFIVAHFRDAMTAAAWDQAAGRAVERAIAVHFPESIDAWLLALLGLLAAALAGWKTYGADHPYPGYGRISRKRNEAYETYCDKQETAIDSLKEIRNKFNNSLSAAQAGNKYAVQAIGQHASLLKQRDSFLQRCDNAVNGLLNSYRKANQGQRSQPPPGHFHERYNFPEAPPMDGLPSEIRLPNTGLNAAVVDDSLKKVHDAFNDAINSIPAVDKPDNPMP